MEGWFVLVLTGFPPPFINMFVYSRQPTTRFMLCAPSFLQSFPIVRENRRTVGSGKGWVGVGGGLKLEWM